jgi:hypothetical protein
MRPLARPTGGRLIECTQTNSPIKVGHPFAAGFCGAGSRLARTNGSSVVHNFILLAREAHVSQLPAAPSIQHSIPSAGAAPNPWRTPPLFVVLVCALGSAALSIIAAS